MFRTKKIILALCCFLMSVFVLSILGYTTPFQVLKQQSLKHTCQQLVDGKEISLENAYQKYKANCAVFFDTREITDYKKSHISKSFYLSDEGLNQNLKNMLNLVDTGTAIILYAERSSSANCEKIATTLQAQGASHVYILKEGFWGWESNGYPTVNGIISELTFYFGLRYAQ